MCKKIYNPKEAICLIIYIEKKTLIDISKKLYGKRNTRISDWIKDLLKENKIVVKPNIDHIRKPYYQTKPETFLNYIVKTLQDRERECNTEKYEISLTSKEKTKMLKYLKSPHFIKIANNFVSNMPIKSEHFTFSGLIDIFSWHCIYEYVVTLYVNQRGYLDTTKINDYIKESKGNKKNAFDLMILGKDLVRKLTNLNPRARWIFRNYDKLITMIEAVNQIYIIQLKEKIKELEPSS